MDYTKEKIVEMTGTDIAEHGNWIKDLDSKNDFMGADTIWLSESASRVGKTSDTNEDYTEVVGAFLLENGFIEKDNFSLQSICNESSFVARRMQRIYSIRNSELNRVPYFYVGIFIRS